MIDSIAIAQEVDREVRWRDARLRAWADHGLPFRARWTLDPFPAPCAAIWWADIRVDCLACGRPISMCGSLNLAFYVIVPRVAEALRDMERSLASCAHLAPLFQGDPAEVLDLIPLELLDLG